MLVTFGVLRVNCVSVAGSLCVIKSSMVQERTAFCM